MTIIRLRDNDMTADMLTQVIERVTQSSKVKMEDSGKMYTTVGARIEALRVVTGVDFGVETDIVRYPNETDRSQTIVMRAIIRDRQGRIVATGHAEETRGANWINETSALEACETSAIGRALAAMGIHGGEYASMTELDIAASKRARATISAPSAGSNGRSQTTTAGTPTPTSTTAMRAAGATNQEAMGMTVSAEGGWKTAVEAFRTFAQQCQDVKSLQDFWTRNKNVVDDMKANAPVFFNEIRDIFRSREAYLTAKTQP